MSETAFVLWFWVLIYWIVLCLLATLEYIWDKLDKKARPRSGNSKGRKGIKLKINVSLLKGDCKMDYTDRMTVDLEGVARDFFRSINTFSIPDTLTPLPPLDGEEDIFEEGDDEAV